MLVATKNLIEGLALLMSYPEDWRGFLNDMMGQAVKIRRNGECNGLNDPPMILTFGDGSELKIVNPFQVIAPAIMIMVR
jgi:hypothetical protein